MQNWENDADRRSCMILTEEAEVLRNKSVPLALCPSQIGLGSNCCIRGDSLDTSRSAAPPSRLITSPLSPQSRSPDFSAHLTHYFFFWRKVQTAVTSGGPHPLLSRNWLSIAQIDTGPCYLFHLRCCKKVLANQEDLVSDWSRAESLASPFLYQIPCSPEG